MIKSVVFDFDGTLAHADTDDGRCVADFSQSYGLKTWDTQKLCANYTDPDHYDLGWGLELLQQRAALYDYYKYVIANFEYYPETHPRLLEGVPEMLQELMARDYQLYLATSRDRHTMRVTLDKNNLDDVFAKHVTITCINEIQGQNKPAGDMIDFLVNNHQLVTDNAIVVGDTTHDIGMAKAARLPVIAITHGSHGIERLNAAKPDHMVHSIPELKNMLLRL